MSGRVPSKKAKAVADEGSQRRKSDTKENRKKKREEILQRKRGGGGASAKHELIQQRDFESDKETDLDDPIYSEYIGSQVDLDDMRYEQLLLPRKLKLKNLHAKATKSDILSFFKDTASIQRVALLKQQNGTRSCEVELKNREETRNAMKMNGGVIRVEAIQEDLGRPVFIGRMTNNRRTVFVSHFKKGENEEATKKELQKILGRSAKIVGIFVPDNLEFGYILVEKCSVAFEKALARGSIKKGGQKIIVRNAFMVPEVLDMLKRS